MPDIAFPSGYERRLAPLALRSLRVRRRRLLGQARGRVLDLGGCVGHADLYPDADEVTVLTTAEEHGDRLRRRAEGAATEVSVRDADLAAVARSGERFDAVVSVLQLSRANDLDIALELVLDVMTEQGRLFFLEPTGAAGVAGQAQRALSPAVRIWTGRRAERDVPGALRRAGFVLADCERLTMPIPWPFSTFVQGVADRSAESSS